MTEGTRVRVSIVIFLDGATDLEQRERMAADFRRHMLMRGDVDGPDGPAPVDVQVAAWGAVQPVGAPLGVAR